MRYWTRLVKSGDEQTFVTMSDDEIIRRYWEPWKAFMKREGTWNDDLVPMDFIDLWANANNAWSDGEGYE